MDIDDVPVGGGNKKMFPEELPTLNDLNVGEEKINFK